jgi:hypothetical protein
MRRASRASRDINRTIEPFEGTKPPPAALVYKAAKDEGMNDTSENSETRRLPKCKPIVLLVEDEAVLRFTIAEELRFYGLKVVEATTADEAVAILGRSLS